MSGRVISIDARSLKSCCGRFPRFFDLRPDIGPPRFCDLRRYPSPQSSKMPAWRWYGGGIGTTSFSASEKRSKIGRALGKRAADERLASQMTSVSVPSVACTPDRFPGLMATAIRKGDIAAWAARHEIVTR
jgi:hypothetical protein